MDNSPEGIAPQPELATLSYDEDVAYEEQLPTEAERLAAEAASLANRIGHSKVYLLSESSVATRTVKRKHDDAGEDGAMDEDEEMDDSDPTYRSNAILFQGTPIANLPTARLFAYATHFDGHPMGLEWVDDQTCVFVFPSKKDAQQAFTRLTKPTNAATTEPSEEIAPMSLDDPADPSFEYTPAKPFPMALWPPEDRINQTLGKGQGLKGAIRMRWARVDDVKKKGAKSQSQFYRKHGTTAGKELFNGRELPPPPIGATSKRKRGEMSAEDEERRRQELDDELDDFLAEDDRNTSPEEADDNRSGDDSRRRKRVRHGRSSSPSQTTPIDEHEPSPIPSSPPSKMRSDYIANDGRTLLERTSLLRIHPGSNSLNARRSRGGDLASRLTAPLPRRARGRRSGADGAEMDGEFERREERPQLHDRIRSSENWGRGSSDEGSDSRPRRRTRGGRNIREREQQHRDRDRGSERSSTNGRKPLGEGRGERTAERPRKTQQELDDELDAFLNAKD